MSQHFKTKSFSVAEVENEKVSGVADLFFSWVHKDEHWYI